MKPETEEWIAKAEGNWTVANREAGAVDPVWDILCFLAQQCAEQYLKGFLEENGITFRKTHDLLLLYNSTAGQLQKLDNYKQDLAYLGTLGIAARYPGTQATQQEAETALRIAGEVRKIIRSEFSLT